ncbi:FAS-associated factor 1-like [Ruditapes philippinarum]|uniref:FAS-associated factor 1-like n=1 Tax=Ruditapes philippinarum TaxID=129788 RepID=UPI00295B0E63|nr:FAS-associated factor 1-like [Ruditapes philippinarum]
MRIRKSTMASGEREQILADFQACTQLDDIETCIAILDQHDWNLMQAVQSVMSQTDSPTGSVPQPMETAMPDRPLGDEYFSSGILSDPVPWRSDANVIDAATNFDPGSAAGAMPGTSGTGLGSHNKRMLHFHVEYRNRNVDVFIEDSCTVAQIKEQLSLDLGIPICKQELKGWANRKVTDNALLRDLHLPKENTLFLLTPDLHPTDGTAGSSASIIDNLNRSYNLKITCKEGSRYNQFNLNFPGTKTVEEVKRDIFNVSDIPVRHQIWTGWPETTEDSKTIGCIGLSYPSHMLELSRSNLSSTSRKTAQEVVHEIEISEDEEEDDFQANVYDDSELFSHDDLPGSRRKQDPLMPESVKDETEALEHFTREFRERYGETHPVFYVGSLDNAIKDALVVSAKERKLLAIYLHHDTSILANVFCSQIFCNEGIVNYLTNNFLTWAWDMTLSTNSARLITMATRHFGSVAANQIRSYKPDNLPVLLIISRSRATNEVVDVIRGDVTVDELMSKLIQDQEVFSQQQQRDIVEEAEREARESIRTEQDAAYKESLEADRKKKEARQAEERKQQEIERRERMKKAEEERKKMEDEAMKQAIQESLAKKVPDEPPEGCTEVTCTLRIRTPDRQMLLRKFYGSNKLEAVVNYITSQGFHMTDYKLLTTFPRRDLSDKSFKSQTLEALKLCPQETLILEERTDLHD